MNSLYSWLRGRAAEAHVGSLPNPMKPIFPCRNGPAYRLFFASGVVILCAVTSAPQNSGRNVTGQWIWKQSARTNRPQIQFRIVIRSEGNMLRGIYSVDEFVNGKWQGEDGNKTAFVGHIDGSDVKIEFDPLATQPGYERNVSYAPPSDGRKPSMAIIAEWPESAVASGSWTRHRSYPNKRNSPPGTT
jgi:hypothetical protein